jgi:uncharacterized protein (UPF0333 family)
MENTKITTKKVQIEVEFKILSPVIICETQSHVGVFGKDLAR